jgi:hypothetical protein
MIIEIEIEDSIYPTLLDAVCRNDNYKETIDDGTLTDVMIPNPVSRDAFLVAFLKRNLSAAMQLRKQLDSVDIIL